MNKEELLECNPSFVVGGAVPYLAAVPCLEMGICHANGDILQPLHVGVPAKELNEHLDDGCVLTGRTSAVFFSKMLEKRIVVPTVQQPKRRERGLRDCIAWCSTTR